VAKLAKFGWEKERKDVRATGTSSPSLTVSRWPAARLSSPGPRTGRMRGLAHIHSKVERRDDQRRVQIS
jgi:hypothetical protein